MSMDEAIVAMTESNLLTRENILPCERGNAFRMEMEARDRIEKRNSNGVGTYVRSRELIGQKNGMKGRQVQNYIRLSYLIPELQKLIDDGKIGVITGAELSYLTEKEQNDVWDELELTAFEHYPNKAQAIAMKKLSAAGTLDVNAIVDIMEVEKPNQIEHIRYVPRKKDLMEQIPVYLKPEEWKDKDFTDFIGKAIAFYADSLREQHAQELRDGGDARHALGHGRGHAARQQRIDVPQPADTDDRPGEDRGERQRHRPLAADVDPAAAHTAAEQKQREQRRQRGGDGRDIGREQPRIHIPQQRHQPRAQHRDQHGRARRRACRRWWRRAA